MGCVWIVLKTSLTGHSEAILTRPTRRTFFETPPMCPKILFTTLELVLITRKLLQLLSLLFFETSASWNVALLLYAIGSWAPLLLETHVKKLVNNYRNHDSVALYRFKSLFVRVLVLFVISMK